MNPVYGCKGQSKTANYTIESQVSFRVVEVPTLADINGIHGDLGIFPMDNLHICYTLLL